MISFQARITNPNVINARIVPLCNGDESRIKEAKKGSLLVKGGEEIKAGDKIYLENSYSKKGEVVTLVGVYGEATRFDEHGVIKPAILYKTANDEKVQKVPASRIDDYEVYGKTELKELSEQYSKALDLMG